MTQFADGDEKARGEAARFEATEDEAGSAQATELLAKHRVIERALACRRKRLFRVDRDMILGGLKNDLQGAAGAAEHADVDARERRPGFRHVLESGSRGVHRARG